MIRSDEHSDGNVTSICNSSGGDGGSSGGCVFLLCCWDGFASIITDED